MSEILDKNGSMPLPVQLRNLILKRLEEGRYKPGEKLDSIRHLAEEFKVSTRVVIQAIDIMESEQMVARVPAKGVFIAENWSLDSPVIKLVFVFPEQSISLDILAPEVWAMDTELYRGLLAGVIGTRAQVYMEHFPEATSELQLRQQVKRLEEYDAAIFPGVQSTPLRRAVVGKMPVILITPSNLEYDRNKESVIESAGIDNVRRVVQYAYDCGYRTLGALTFPETKPDSPDKFFDQRNGFFQERIDAYRKMAVGMGLNVAEEFLWEVAETPDKTEILKELLRNKCPEFIFCNHAEKAIELYEAAFDLGLVPGRDFGVMCIASGLTFRGLFPACTYFRVPAFEIGRYAAQTAIEAITLRDKFTPIHKVVPSILIQGKSTCQLRPVRKARSIARVKK